MRRSTWPRSATAGAVLLLTVASLPSCAEKKQDDSSVASWDLQRPQRLDSATTELAAVVTRVGCSSGVQGTPQEPKIEYGDTEVTITFRINPRIDDGTCLGTTGVPVTIELDESLGDRSLTDGECHPGSPAWATTFCENDGVRYRPTPAGTPAP